MKKFRPLILCLLGGLLLWGAWPVSPFTFLIFIAFVPLLLFEESCTNRKQFFLFTYLMLLIWNIGTTWWMCVSTVPGGIAALLANSLLMTIPMFGFYNIKRRLGERVGYFSLIACWLTFEYIHLNWQLSWPWLTLGNVFAGKPDWVQWYEYTGTSGGSLWILIVNVLVFSLLKKRRLPQPLSTRPLAVITGTVLLLPLLLSYIIKPDVTNGTGDGKNIVVVQPNIDPYAKFEAGQQTDQLNLLIRLSEQAIDSSTAIIVWPETAISFAGGLDETTLSQNPFLLPVWQFLKKHPRTRLLSGIEGYRLYLEADKSSTARRIRNSEQYCDIYNTAGLFDSTGPLQLYHKSKLVPGVETLPTYLRFIDTWFEEFGGTTGGYASQAERTVLADQNSGYRIAPAICYESIYGEFMSEYMPNGANIIAIITNDGWWANTAGYRQHMQYARLRAIENRRWVIRSANTGISCFISPEGEVFDAKPWDTEATIKRTVPPIETMTFFAMHKDVISIIALLITAILLIRSTRVYIRNRFFKTTGDGKSN